MLKRSSSNLLKLGASAFVAARISASFADAKLNRHFAHFFKVRKTLTLNRREIKTLSLWSTVDNRTRAKIKILLNYLIKWPLFLYKCKYKEMYLADYQFAIFVHFVGCFLFFCNIQNLFEKGKPRVPSFTRDLNKTWFSRSSVKC